MSVVMLKDSRGLTTHERRPRIVSPLAGDAIEVSSDLADNWLTAGRCRLEEPNATKAPFDLVEDLDLGPEKVAGPAVAPNEAPVETAPDVSVAATPAGETAERKPKGAKGSRQRGR